MLGTAIAILDVNAEACARMTIADYASSTLDLSALPPFAFSPKGPKYLSRMACCIKCSQPIHERRGQRNHIYLGDEGPYCRTCADAHVLPVQGPMVPPTISAPRPKGKKRLLSQDEENWLNLKPKFEAPVEPKLVAPHGTTKPFVPESFARREAEYAWLIATQSQDLPSLAQEFRANGLTAFSLSSSPSDENDDEMSGDNIAEPVERTGFVAGERPKADPQVEHDARRYGTPPLLDPETMAALVRRIEWEKTVVYSSQSTRIYAATTEDGRRTLRCNDRRWTKDDLVAYAAPMKDLLADRDMADVENARARANHFGKLVWSLMTPAQQAAWRERSHEVRNYLDIADDNRARESWDIPRREVFVEDDLVDASTLSNGGPQELGLHVLTEDDSVAAYEPTDSELWPLSA